MWQRIKWIGVGVLLALIMVMALVSLPVLADVSYWVFLPVAIVAFVVVAIVHLLGRLVSKRDKAARRWWHWLAPLSLVFILLAFVVALPVYYLAIKVNTNPLLVPQVHLSNGHKEIVFQGMVHIGDEQFYKSVVYDLEVALSEGYKLYYEGVYPVQEESDEWFSDAIAGGDLSEHYRSLADVCGVRFQMDYFEVLAKDMIAHPARHLTADISTAEFKAEYDRLLREDPEFARKAREENQSGEKQASIQTLKSLIEAVQSATPGQKKIVGYLCRGVFASQLSSDSASKADMLLNPVILDYRNRHLVNEALSDEASKIYITYGAAHLPGVLSLLVEQDSSWQVKSIKWLKALSHPDQAQGDLSRFGLDNVMSNSQSSGHNIE